MLAILLQIQLLSSYNGPIPSLVCNCMLKGSNKCDDVDDVTSLMFTTDFTYSHIIVTCENFEPMCVCVTSRRMIDDGLLC